MHNLLANLLLRMLPGTRAFGVKRVLLRLLKIGVGSGSRIAGGTQFLGGGAVDIGREVWVGLNVKFYSVPGTVIRVEDNCDIAPDVTLHSGTHDLGTADRRAGELRGNDITVGRGSWLGVASVILPGARIGPGTIVAAGAVVTAGTYDANILLSGVPARDVRRLD